jgi:hypothetical protein
MVWKEKNMVEIYLGDGWEDLKDYKLNILSWWRRNAITYKILSKIAEHVLAIIVYLLLFLKQPSVLTVVY